VRLREKTALVTGGSRGIGRAIAVGLAMEGADVAVNYLNQSKAAEGIASQIRSLGRRAIAVQGDVSDLDSVEKMVDYIIQEFQHVDILVNNAGSISWRELSRVSKQQWHSIIETNLTGVFNCSKAILPSMIDQLFGKIINVSSVFAFHGHSGTVAYSAAKSGLVGFTRTLAKEVGPKGINVNALAPGYIMTDLTQQAPEREKEEIISTIPLRRAGLPADVASVAVFLASEEASYITGQIIYIDGGWKI
jgi:3-oxoacyl-[acyl-carrier protein] reductase